MVMTSFITHKQFVFKLELFTFLYLGDKTVHFIVMRKPSIFY